MLMAVDFSRTQKGHSVDVLNLYYIVIDLQGDNILLADFRILTICVINLYITGDVFGFNLGIDSTTKYFLLWGYVIQLLKINLWH